VRHFSGICSRVSQGGRDARFTAYELEVVPSLWLLTRKAGSRAFQGLSVPEILERELLDTNASFELRVPFERYEYVVQYGQTDFDFVSRLMEEEGIYYFFRHEAGGHTMVLADTPQSHPALPAVQFDPKARPGTVYEWTKAQELRSGKVTLRDHNFQLPGSNLEGRALIQESVRAGTVEHRLRLPGSDSLEIYDYPGGYAQRFDGIDRGGDEQPGELQKLLEAAQRDAELRMQAEAASALVISGASTAPGLTAGHRFTLERHFDADGEYVLTGVQHKAEASADGHRFTYGNTFTCIPAGLPYRPPRLTPKPVAPGPQPAIVVGPPGETVHADRYGRVKVQFHWDREESHSVWLRVAQPFAGGSEGSFFLPEVGDEVLVAFEHDDVRRPYVLGRLWNTTDTPPEREDGR
jgi:type VI secretion system secreted protein VgrG